MGCRFVHRFHDTGIHCERFLVNGCRAMKNWTRPSDFCCHPRIRLRDAAPFVFNARKENLAAGGWQRVFGRRSLRYFRKYAPAFGEKYRLKLVEELSTDLRVTGQLETRGFWRRERQDPAIDERRND